MHSYYTIIIPIFNEVQIIPKLLKDLKQLQEEGHEVLIVDDGSTDGSYDILSQCTFISLIQLKNNFGKGVAIKKGIIKSLNEKIVLFDGDRELKTKEIFNLMILDKKKKIYFTIGNRKMISNYDNIIWIIGNKFLTFIFNAFHNSNLKDALCCAKAFYKSDINLNKIKAEKFDIDVEIASHLVKQKKTFDTIFLTYHRRNIYQGKKLRLRDGLRILYRILKC